MIYKSFIKILKKNIIYFQTFNFISKNQFYLYFYLCIKHFINMYIYFISVGIPDFKLTIIKIQPAVWSCIDVCIRIRIITLFRIYLQCFLM